MENGIFTWFIYTVSVARFIELCLDRLGLNSELGLFFYCYFHLCLPWWMMSGLWSVNLLSNEYKMTMMGVYKGKKVKERIAVNGTQSHRYGVSLAVWDHAHAVLPATRHKWAQPAFTPARQAGTRFTDHLRVEGWVSPGPRCKEHLTHCCYATARSQRGRNLWPSDH